jgi:hypothetical protein
MPLRLWVGWCGIIRVRRRSWCGERVWGDVSKAFEVTVALKFMTFGSIESAEVVMLEA